MRKGTFISVLSLVLLAFSGLSWAGPTTQTIYYSRTTTDLTVPGTYTFKFSLWSAASAGTEVWWEQKSLTVTTKTLTTYLGSVNNPANRSDLLSDLDFSQQYWVQVDKLEADGVTFTPVGVRTKFNVVPYAMWSVQGGDVNSVTAGDGLTSTDIIGDVTLNVGPGAGISVDADTVSIAADGVTSSMLAANAVTSDKIAANSVTTDKIAAGAVTDAKITGQIDASKINPTGLDADTVDGKHYSDITGYVDTQVSAEASAREGADTTLTTNLSNEVTRAQTAEASFVTMASADATYVTKTAAADFVDKTNDQTIGGAKTFNSPLASTVSTGTAPLTVASTTMVGNLNSEMVGGLKASQLVPAIPTQAPRSNIITTVDASANIVGQFTSITIGTDGLPVISYYDYTDSALKVLKCGNASCSSGNTITKVDDPANIVGIFTSITIGTDGLPVISYQDYSAKTLKTAKCGNASCSSGNTITTVDDPANEVGQFTSITIGTDGMPVISYQDTTAGALKVLKCGDASCSSGNTITTVDDPANQVGQYTSITIGTDGLPVISYFDTTAFSLKVAKCGDASCSSGNTITTVDDPANYVGGQSTSITIGTDGLPVISYQDTTAGALKVAKCGNASCSSGNTITTVDDPANQVGQFTSITVGTDGLPVISYNDATAFSLKVAKCGNASCSSGNTITTVDDPANYVGSYPSITIGTDGLPVISYFDTTAQSLKVVKCANQFCINNWARR